VKIFFLQGLVKIFFSGRIIISEGNTMNKYQEQGYESRKHYLQCLAEDLGIDVETVYATASMLGASEDFDGLVTTLEDYADGF
jgi:hypothetical protein